MKKELYSIVAILGSPGVGKTELAFKMLNQYKNILRITDSKLPNINLFLKPLHEAIFIDEVNDLENIIVLLHTKKDLPKIIIESQNLIDFDFRDFLNIQIITLKKL